MVDEPGLFDFIDEAAEAAADARAEADIAAGRVIPHEEVKKWLLTWGTPEEGPPPRAWFEDPQPPATPTPDAE
jgi:predicted transcriptional regulator